MVISITKVNIVISYGIVEMVKQSMFNVHFYMIYDQIVVTLKFEMKQFKV